MTSLEPKLDRDIVLLDFRLVRNCKRKWVPTFQKYVSWVTLALLLCDNSRVQNLEEKKLASIWGCSPYSTCRGAGVAWEVRALGGTITPVCAADYDFSTQIGLALRSAAWNLYHMAIPNKWIRAVLSKEHWNTQPDPLHIPFNSVLSLETQVDEGSGGDDDESSMGSEVLSMPTALKNSSRQRADVVVHTPSRRPGQN